MTLEEFRETMEVVGAKKLPDRRATQFRKTATECCFKFAGITFAYDYNINNYATWDKIPEEIIKRAMGICPEYKSFHGNRIFTVNFLLTLLTLIEGRYSVNLVYQITNKVYKKIYNCPTSASDFSHWKHNPKMLELENLVSKYDEIVNIFCNNSFYMPGFTIGFRGDVRGWCYSSTQQVKGSFTLIQHSYYSGYNDEHAVDDVIHLDYTGSDKRFNIELNISLETGLAWELFEYDAFPATDYEITRMMTHLKANIKRMKKISHNMAEK